MRARPPENLTVSEESDGSRLLRWSSPYPPSSSLSKNVTYQLSFRTQAEDTWTVSSQHIEPHYIDDESWQSKPAVALLKLTPHHIHLSTQKQTVANTSLKLERQRLLPGRRYEARVRARAALGRWSEWTPLVIWKTGDGE